jgi:hypothetical protein
VYISILVEIKELGRYKIGGIIFSPIKVSPEKGPNR